MKTDETFENTFYLQFIPHHWGHYNRFSHFFQTTHVFDKDTRSAVRGVAGHADKARHLFYLADKLVPLMAEERAQHEGKGVIPGVRSGEFAALAECVLGELYSVLDCTRKTIAGIYGKLRGIPRDSTRKLFANAKKDIIDVRVPASIRQLLADATWYDEFRRLRDGVAHGETGSCHLDSKSGSITYFHVGLGSNTRAFVINDIHAELKKYFTIVFALVESIFAELNHTIKDERFFTICGMFRGRIYSRLVSIREATDFNSGVCNSCEWCEKPENPRCPMTKSCGAYARAKQSTEPMGAS